MFRKRCVLPFMLVFALAACGGSATPQLIGSYPQGGEPPIAYYEPVPAQPLTINYHASLEMDVEDTQRALHNIQWIASQHSGYLLNSATWHEANRLYGEATIAVPVSRFEAAISALRGLGSVRAERISGEVQSAYVSEAGWEGYSEITVSLRPASADWGRQIGGFLTGSLQFVFRAALILVPITLMMIGLVTVVRWAGSRLQARVRTED
jgi:hypothetical protein